MNENQEERFKVRGQQFVEKIKDLIAEGNVRRIIIKDSRGKELFAFPLHLG